MKLTVKDIKGNSAGELDVTFHFAEGDKGLQAVHDTVVAYQAAQRSGTACTKNVGDVAGTNKKPWRQKGTGRARAGSFASPLWRGGGVVFGPKPRDFRKKISKATRQLALRKALTERLNAGDVHVVEEIKLEAARTKAFIGFLASMQLGGKTALIVGTGMDETLKRASGNIRSVEITTSDTLNTYQVLKYDKILFTRNAFEQLEARIKD